MNLYALTTPELISYFLADDDVRVQVLVHRLQQLIKESVLPRSGLESHGLQHQHAQRNPTNGIRPANAVKKPTKHR